MEDMTRNILPSQQTREEFDATQRAVNAKLIKDKIRFLEQIGYRVVLNNTKSNTNRDNDMIKVLEANGYKVTKET